MRHGTPLSKMKLPFSLIGLQLQVQLKYRMNSQMPDIAL